MNPDYGIWNMIGAEAVAYASRFGVRAAAEHFNVHPSTIYSWRKNLTEPTNA